MNLFTIKAELTNQLGILGFYKSFRLLIKISNRRSMGPLHATKLMDKRHPRGNLDPHSVGWLKAYPGPPAPQGCQ